MATIKITKGPSKEGEKDTVRIKNNMLYLSVNVFSGKQGDYHILYCPSLNISGYGNTEKEAEDFLHVEMETFSEDVLGMSSEEKENFLLSLGFKREKFRKKNFSKAYVDQDGKLCDFDEGTLERRILEVV